VVVVTVDVPSVTVHLPDEEYSHVINTCGDNKSGRIAELVRKGIEMEQSANGENEEGSKS